MSHFRTVLQRSIAGVVCLVLLALKGTGCGNTQLVSSPQHRPITIDAEAGDWSGLPMYADKGGINLSVTHDAEYLYLLVSTTTQSLQRQILRGGFTVWFDPEGGSDEVFGIRYPLGMGGGPPPGARGELTATDEVPPMDGMNEPPRTGRMNDRPLTGDGPQPGTELEILGPGEDERMMTSLVTEKDIQARISSLTGALTYELRVPLDRDARHPNGIGVSPDRKVGVKLETMQGGPGGMGRPKAGGEEMRPPDGSGPSGDGGMPPGGGGRGGPGGGRGPGGGPQGGGRGSLTQIDPIDVHVTVKLDQ
jgi:hypothetical protein